MNRKDRYTYIIEYFSKHNPDATSELEYKNPYELLIAVVLSAQCTDKRVNMTTPNFFKRYPTVEKLSEATPEEIFEHIRSITYPNSKSKYLSGLAKMIVKDFNSNIPDNIDDLQKLPGVGRKTANVVVSVLFNKPAMAVDTHVFRVSARIGLTVNAKTPEQAEKQLVSFFPEHIIAKAHHWLILHGRYVCLARKPKCEKCGITKACKHYNTIVKQQATQK